jgi:hypothetical protein
MRKMGELVQINAARAIDGLNYPAKGSEKAHEKAIPIISRLNSSHVQVRVNGTYTTLSK